MHPLKQNAEIAQLVEHNLAKVRVASSSLVFRSFFERMLEWWNGRHEGLKILWPLRLCGFKSRFEYTSLSKQYFAEVAQLVEHNLAKVRVAGSSPVFRSTLREEVDARMVESVDTKDLKSFGHCGCAGSSPASSTQV